MQHSADLGQVWSKAAWIREWERTRPGKWSGHRFTHDYVGGIECCVGDETALYPHLCYDLAACVAYWGFFTRTFVGNYGETLRGSIFDCSRKWFGEHQTCVLGYHVCKSFSLDIRFCSESGYLFFVESPSVKNHPIEK